MEFGTRHSGIMKAASVAALLAWMMLQAMGFAHAEMPHHSDVQNGHCAICSHSAPDDKLFTPIANAQQSIPIAVETLSPRKATDTAPQVTILGRTARGPPSHTA